MLKSWSNKLWDTDSSKKKYVILVQGRTFQGLRFQFLEPLLILDWLLKTSFILSPNTIKDINQVWARRLKQWQCGVHFSLCENVGYWSRMTHFRWHLFTTWSPDMLALLLKFCYHGSFKDINAVRETRHKQWRFKNFFRSLKMLDDTLKMPILGINFLIFSLPKSFAFRLTLIQVEYLYQWIIHDIWV